MTLTLLPSAVGVFVTWCKANTDLLAVHGGRVATRLNATLPAIRVTRIGGNPQQEIWQDWAELQVECWATDDPTAELLARQVLAALPTIRGTYAYGHVWTYGDVNGPYWAPDDPNLSNNARYILSFPLLTTP
jgi:hypothetical protein